MKDPLVKPVNFRPFFYDAQPGRRSRAYQEAMRKRRQQRRLLLLGVILLAVLTISAAAGWGIFQLARPLLAAGPKDARDFEAFMAREFSLYSEPSLLYDNNLSLALHTPVNLKNKLLPLQPQREDKALKQELEALFASYGPRFKTYFYYYNPQDNSYVEVNGYYPVAAASVIKLPILLDYLLGLDTSLFRLNTPILYADHHRAGGAGSLQYKPAGVVFPVNQVASQMIRVSDNTCTNIMIAALGGTDAVNRKLAELGLVHTRIRNWLPDLEGTNTISAYEMATVLYNIDHGPLISKFSRYNGLGILESTHNRRLLVSPLPPEARVAHKTGDIGTALGDSGIVYLPDGRKYIISVQVERPFNDYAARDMIQQASRLIYDHVASQPEPGTNLAASRI